MVLYRKYRSQTLDELMGQETVKSTLKSAFAKNNLAHAYLFCGPRGTGKTSTARILAKMVNCEKTTDYSLQTTADSKPLVSNLSIPCNQCPACLAITQGTHLDVVEMDAASNRGIEDIRLLRENIKLATSGAKKKVYIIDEVHMLTGDAFNALLKTLEEPPNHVLFILATTEIQKIPQTILSRVQKLDFKLAKVEELVEVLTKVAGAEKIEIEKEALLALAKAAQGSFRDGIKLLDQFSNSEKVDLKMVEDALGKGTAEEVLLLLEKIAEGEGGAALQKVMEAVEKGVNLKEFTLSILDNLRQLLLLKNGLSNLVKNEVAEEKYIQLVKVGDKFEIGYLVEVINHFQTSLEQSRFVSIPSLPLEIAVVQSCLIKCSQRTVDTKVKKEEPSIKMTAFVSTESVDTAGSFQSDLQKIAEKWGYVLETVRQFNFSLEALLRSSKIVSSNEKNVVVEVPYSFHQRIIEAPKSRDFLESIFSDILGRSVRVSTRLGQRVVRSEELANVEVAADDEIVRLAAEIFNTESVN